MRSLHLFLERGFSGEEVEVRLGEERIFRSEALREDMMMGFAAQVDAPLPPGEATLSVLLPEEGLRHQIPVPAGDVDLWIVVRRLPDELIHEVGTEPLGFL